MATARNDAADGIRPLPTLQEEETNGVETLMQAISLSEPKQADAAPSPSPSPPQQSLPQQPTATTASKQASTIPYLPTEIIQEILFYLNPHDYDSARLTCHDWFQAASCRALLERQIGSLHNIPGATSRGNHLPARENFSVTSRRRYFNVLITEWPGSRHRVQCLKTRLDTRALINAANSIPPNGGSSNTENLSVTGFECVGVSRQTGSFVALVIGRPSQRKLYICRMFSKTHRTIESRPHRYSNCPCVPEPGPLYMAFDIKTGLNLRIVKVEMEEVEQLSSVRELSIVFETGVAEKYSFEGLVPHRIYQLNIQDKAIKTALGAHAAFLYAQNHPFQQPVNYINDKNAALSHNRLPVQQGNKFRGMIQGLLHFFQKNRLGGEGTNPALLEIKPVGLGTSEMMRVRVLGREEVCQIIRVKFDKEGSNAGIIAVSPVSNTIYVCGTSPSMQQYAPTDPSTRRKKSEPSENVTVACMHHWLVPPPRKSGNGEITHISVAPLMHWDFGQRIGYMGVIAGYSNGEVWFWRMSRGWRHLVPSGSDDEDAQMEDMPAAGQYRPDQTPCISANIPSRQEFSQSRTAEMNLPILSVISPEEASQNDLLHSNTKAWKLAYLPGLKALNFVNRGVVILAADEKFVWGFDLRELYGFEKNTVEPPSVGTSLMGGGWGGQTSLWGHSGEVLEGTIGGGPVGKS